VDCLRHLLGRFCVQPLTEFSGRIFVDIGREVGGHFVSLFSHLLGRSEADFSRHIFTSILLGVRSLSGYLFSHLC
jgi:hypothetical protein